MDVAAVRTARLRLLALVVAVAALVALLVVQVLNRADDGGATADRQRACGTALDVGRTQGRNLTTIGYRSATTDLARILAGATGKLREQFASQRTQLPALLARQKSESTGSVLAAGLISCAPVKGNARVNLAVDATVTTSDAPAPVVKHYRITMTLQRTGSRWLVSDVAFAGAPQ